MAASRSCSACGRGDRLKRRAILVVAAVLWVAAAPASAHDETGSTSDVFVSGASIRWRVEVGLDGLRKAVALPGLLTDQDLAPWEAAIGRYVSRGLRVTSGGHVLDGTVTGLRPILEPSAVTGLPAVGRVEVEMTFVAPATVEELGATVAFFADVTPRHLAIVGIRWSDATGSPHAADRGVAPRPVGFRPSSFAVVGPSEIKARRAATGGEMVARMPAFFRWGAYHIFTGYDHLAFLVALLVTSSRLRGVVGIVTAFTASHSITLMLAALDLVRVPARVSEAAIAASIVYVAAENLVRRRAGQRETQRWPLTFAFGLVHGLGFASALRERLLGAVGEAPSFGRWVGPVLMFNLGVEAGQLAVVAVVFPLLTLLYHRDWRRQGAPGSAPRWPVTATSLPILLLGLYWFVQRITM